MIAQAGAATAEAGEVAGWAAAAGGGQHTLWLQRKSAMPLSPRSVAPKSVLRPTEEWMTGSLSWVGAEVGRAEVGEGGGWGGWEGGGGEGGGGEGSEARAVRRG